MVPVVRARRRRKAYIREPVERLIVLQLMQEASKTRLSLERALDVDEGTLASAVETLQASGVIVSHGNKITASPALLSLDELGLIAL